MFTILDLTNVELFKMKSKYRSNYTEIDESNDINKKLLDTIKKVLSANVQNFSVNSELLSEEKQFYDSEIAVNLEDSTNLCFRTRHQNNNLWIQERKKRITASNAYGFFTYTKNKKPDWDKTISSYLNSSFKGNADTKHGLQSEDDAVRAYEKATGATVTKMGLLVNPAVSWLGFSPDGIVIDQNIVEIKSPKVGKSMTAATASMNLPFMEDVNGNMLLKEKHKYYCQIQLGMYITGLSNCHFVIYSSMDSTIYVLNIPYNKSLVEKEYLPALSNVYFKHILRLLTLREKENSGCNLNK